jgi:predicted HTH transcriptional regulator
LCQLSPAGQSITAKLRNVRDQIEECVSAFANATGGLLVLGVSSSGAVMGLKHLNEEQLNALLKVERLVSSQLPGAPA